MIRLLLAQALEAIVVLVLGLLLIFLFFLRGN